METYVRGNKLKAALEDEALCKRRFGEAMAKKIMLRVTALRAAASLGDFWPPMSGPERCHELSGDRAGTFSIDVKQPYRLLFVPIEAEPGKKYPDEQQRWKAITSVEIQSIEDTHG